MTQRRNKRGNRKEKVVQKIGNNPNNQCGIHNDGMMKSDIESSRNRYNMHFNTEKLGIESKKNNHLPIAIHSEKDLEISSSEIFPSGLDFPKRQEWSYDMSPEKLDIDEKKAHTEFIEKYNSKEISLFEHNLETWRQLWRVCEKSDVLLIIVDARFAIAQFPPYLYSHICEELEKGVILVINKCDMISDTLANSLRDYFCKEYKKILVVPFSSGRNAVKCIKKNSENILHLIDAIRKISNIKVNFNKWIRKIEGIPENDTSETTQETPDVTLTIGTIGYPNVGKSSFINLLRGKKVVSVSKTPGHTKHYQTIYLTNDIILCDCPGLVFPCTTPFSVQVIMGSYPVAQVRNPMAVIGYVCRYVNIPKILNLTIAEASSDEKNWTPFLVCEAFAIKMNFRLRNSGNGDAYRGGNLLLRNIVDGNYKIIISLRTPGFSDKYGLGCDVGYRSTEVQQCAQAFPQSKAIESSILEDSSSDESNDLPDYSNKFSFLPLE